MSDRYLTEVNKTKDLLNKISPSMCMAKWLQVSLHLPQGLTQSCYHPPTHEIPLDNIKNNPSVLHNTEFKIKERKQMREGKRPTGCQYCWNLEDGNHLSDRHYRSNEPWAKGAWEKVAYSDSDKTINPRYVEVNFNQACNFKCTYCSPHLSTTWEKEVDKYGPIKISDTEIHNDINILAEEGLMPITSTNKENPYVQAFWKWWPDLYNDLKVFRMTGGEPLMDKNTFKVLEYTIDNPNSDLEISITSNMCPPDQKLFEKFIKTINSIESPIDKSVFDKWKKAGLICEVDYYAQNDGNNNWQQWPRFIVIDKHTSEYIIDIDKGKKRINKSDIKRKFDSTGRDPVSGDFLYSLIWFKSNKNNNWECLGSPKTELEGNKGVYLDVPKIKNFMLFASVDAVGKRAEYIRSGLDWTVFKNNVNTYLQETNNTEITFINTFNFLSITSLKKFLTFVLKLRQRYGTLEDSRVWFDIPYLRQPNWMNIQLAAPFPDLLEEIENCISFMKIWKQTNDEIGFHDYEIAKLTRNLEWIKSTTDYIDRDELKNRQSNFYKYFSELDRRRDTNFLEVFPELEDVWNYYASLAESTI